MKTLTFPRMYLWCKLRGDFSLFCLELCQAWFIVLENRIPNDKTTCGVWVPGAAPASWVCICGRGIQSGSVRKGWLFQSANYRDKNFQLNIGFLLSNPALFTVSGYKDLCHLLVLEWGRPVSLAMMHVVKEWICSHASVFHFYATNHPKK